MQTGLGGCLGRLSRAPVGLLACPALTARRAPTRGRASHDSRDDPVSQADFKVPLSSTPSGCRSSKSSSGTQVLSWDPDPNMRFVVQHAARCPKQAGLSGRCREHVGPQLLAPGTLIPAVLQRRQSSCALGAPTTQRRRRKVRGDKQLNLAQQVSEPRCPPG